MASAVKTEEAEVFHNFQMAVLMPLAPTKIGNFTNQLISQQQNQKKWISSNIIICWHVNDIKIFHNEMINPSRFFGTRRQ